MPASAAAPSGSRFTRCGSLPALTVALQHLDIGEQVVAEGDRLRDLQVGEARHDEAAWRSAWSSSARLQIRDQAAQLVDLRAQPQPHVGRHLVVARARGMQALARVADQRRQPALDVEVHVLGVERPAKAPGVDLPPDALEAAPDRRQVAAREDPCAASMPAWASDAWMSYLASAGRRRPRP